MNLFRAKKAAENEPQRRSRDPGHGVDPAEIFEVWGDLIDMSDRDVVSIDALGKQATHYIATQLQRLLNLNSQASSNIRIEFYRDSDEQDYILVGWGDLRGELGARRFGACLDLFGILMIPKGWLTNNDPNPLVRLSRLNAVQRRDVTIFQSLLKYVLDLTAEALDEQRIS